MNGSAEVDVIKDIPENIYCQASLWFNLNFFCFMVKSTLLFQLYQLDIMYSCTVLQSLKPVLACSKLIFLHCIILLL